jgi:secreted trypsin-like serine protease
MTPVLRSLLLAALLAACGTSAFAADAPNPYRTVPPARAAAAAAGGDVIGRVFGGDEVPDDQYPFQVALLKASDLTESAESQYGAQFCGGTLVAPNFVLTAAHCMTDGSKPLVAGDIVVLAGSHDLTAGKRIAVKSIVLNDLYNQASLDHDAALLELSDPVALPPVTLDFAGDAITPTANIVSALVLGWGMNENGEYPKHLLETRLDVVPSADCNIGIKAIYAKDLKVAVKNLGDQYFVSPDDSARIGDEMASRITDPLTPAMICAGLKSGKRDSCYGDSGGPLIADIGGKPVQLGIVSWGEGPADSDVKCGHQDAYGVYSRVSVFKDWIQSTLDGH